MAPLIAGIVSTLISNNLPKVAQAVVDKGLDYVQEKTGVELKPDMTPQELAQLRERAMQHDEFEVEQDNKNVADARAMQVAALQQDHWFAKHFIYIFASAWSLFSMAFFVYVSAANLPERSVRMADTILGVLIGTVITGFFNFFFGSSKSSKDKTDALLSLRDNK